MSMQLRELNKVALSHMINRRNGQDRNSKWEDKDWHKNSLIRGNRSYGSYQALLWLKARRGTREENSYPLKYSCGT